jgi:hypothetical protein
MEVSVVCASSPYFKERYNRVNWYAIAASIGAELSFVISATVSFLGLFILFLILDIFHVPPSYFDVGFSTHTTMIIVSSRCGYKDFDLVIKLT